MPSGGSRARSGPAPDPNALRRDRKDDAAWVTLPSTPVEKVPEFPLPTLAVYGLFVSGAVRSKVLDTEKTDLTREAELALWAELWRKPQAHMWLRLGLEYEVAAYVRAFVRSVGAGGNASDRTAALRMAAEIGLSLPGMHSLRWKFSTDELAEKRAEAAEVASAASVRSRLGAVSGGR